MRIVKTGLIALAATVAVTSLAHATDVKKRREAPGTPAEVWAVVGDFCAIEKWHPAVTKCEQVEEDGVTYRNLTLKDGGKIKEKLTETDETSYSYEIVDSPLPVENYSATLLVEPDDEDDRVAITWTATFDPKDGTEEAEASKVISGIFNAGLTGIKHAAIEAYDAREAAAGRPVSKGRDRSQDNDDDDGN